MKQKNTPSWRAYILVARMLFRYTFSNSLHELFRCLGKIGLQNRIDHGALHTMGGDVETPRHFRTCLPQCLRFEIAMPSEIPTDPRQGKLDLGRRRPFGDIHLQADGLLHDADIACKRPSDTTFIDYLVVNVARYQWNPILHYAYKLPYRPDGQVQLHIMYSLRHDLLIPSPSVLWYLVMFIARTREIFQEYGGLIPPKMPDILFH